MKTKIFFTVLFLLFCQFLFAQNTYVVDVTFNGGDFNPGDGICDDGNGNCTLWAALEEANADGVASNIHFNIPGPEPHVIAFPAAFFDPLPSIIENNPLIIDGTTEPGNDPMTGLIILQGNFNNENGFNIQTSAPVEIYGIQIQFCNTAISTSLTFGNINLKIGAEEMENVLVDNLTGINAFSDGSIEILNNFIGTDLTGADRGNGEVGIFLNEIVDGLNSTIKENVVNFNNTGMTITSTAVISLNEIRFNDDVGVETFKNQTSPATLTENSFRCNPIPFTIDGAATSPFFISTANTIEISGTADPNEIVEIFVFDDSGCPNDPCQGTTFLGGVTADNSGNWTLSGNFNLGDEVTATATSQSGITRGFATCQTVVAAPCSVEIQYSSAQNPGLNSGDLAQDCPANLISLFALPSPAGSYDAEWIFPDGSIDCCTSGSIVAILEGEYTLNVTETGSGCMATDKITVDYFPQPSVNITTSPTNTFCNGQPINANLTATSGFAAYDWSNGGGSQSINVTTTGDFTVTATDSNGCFDTATETITELPPVVVDACVSINSGSLNCTDAVTACAGDLIEISAVNSGGTIGGFANYDWSTGESGTSLSTIIVTTADQYDVTVTDSQGCTEVATVLLNIANPMAAVSSDFSVCEGETIQLQEFGGDAFGWNWSGPDNFMSGAQSPSIPNAQSINTGNYFVTITDLNGCTDTDNLTVTVDPAPTAFISGSPTQICEGENVNLQIDFTGIAPFTFIYSINGVNQPAQTVTSNPFIFVETPSQNTDYELVSVSDNSGCNGSVSGLVSVMVTPFPTANSTTIESCDDGNGSSTFDLTTVENTVNGGTGLPVSWYEDSGQATPITNPTNYFSDNGSVFATVIDNGCESAPAEIFLVVSTASLTNCMELTPVSMVGGNDGVASIDITGNSNPYDYTLSPGSMTGSFPNNGNHTISGLSADSYTLTVVNNIGCIYNCNFTITEPDCSNFSSTLVGNDVNCLGGNDGSITTTVNNGSGDYNFDWSDDNLDGLQNPAGLSAGGYVVTITDNVTGCITIGSVTINEPTTAVAATISNFQNVDCFGNATGSATVSATGGTVAGDYLYNWSNLETTATINALTAQIYSVTVTDDNGCTDVATIEITQPNELTVSVITTDEMSFNANDGTATASPLGGTVAIDYQYNWSNTETTQAISNLPPDDYFVTVTDDNGCTATDSGTVNPFICTPINITINKIDISCTGADDGSTTASANGDNPPFTFSWSNGMTGNTASDLGPGTYTVTATDAANCTETAQITILEPDVLTLSMSSTDETSFGANDGTATANPMGGTPNYSYNWSNGGNTQTINSLPPDTYDVTVTDANGCTVLGSTTVNPFGCGFIDVTLITDDVSCNGFDDGEASATATGTNPPFTFSWSTGQNGNNIDNLAPNNYSLTVTDASNCDTVLNFVIIEPALLTVSTNITDETSFGANDGTATANPSGGTPNYSYNWSNGSNIQTINNLEPNNYNVTVTDANGCIAVGNAVVNPFNCTPINITILKNDVTCNGFDDGDAIASATGDNPPFTFSWSNGMTGNMISDLAPGIYTVTATDAANCTETAQITIIEPDLLTVSTNTTDETSFGANDGTATANPSGGTPNYSYNWSNGGNTQTINNLEPDNYNITITDVNGCLVVGNAVVNPFNCTPINITILKNDVTCNGFDDGTATASATGDNPPFTFSWSTGVTGTTISDLAPGTYTITATDAANCTETSQITILEPDVLSLSMSSTDETSLGANNGTATANPSGGTPNYFYNWSNGGNTQTISNLPPDDYSVTITDENGCTVIGTTSVNLFGCNNLTVNLLTMDVTSFGGSNGAATATVSGDNPPFQFNWSTGPTTSTINNLIAGNYALTVTDNTNCDTIINFEIIQPDTFMVEVIVTPETANNANDGTATANASGGVQPYSYLWSNAETTQTINNLMPDTYGVTVTDENGNTATASSSVEAFNCDSIDIAIQKSDINCFGFANGIASATATGGNEPYLYEWSNGIQNQEINNLIPGMYVVSVTDAAGCPAIDSIEISQPDTLSLIITTMDVSMIGGNDGFAAVTATGGVPNYGIVWENGETNDTITGLMAGTYGVTVTDQNDCPATGIAVINEPNSNLTLETSQQNVSCNEGNDGLATVIVIDGNAPFTILWSNGETTETINNLEAGSYSVEVMDATGASQFAAVNISEPSVLALSFSILNGTCANESSGSASVSATGGTEPYTFNWEDGQTGMTATNLPVGEISVTVEGANGCTATTSINIPEIALPTADLQGDFSICEGDTWNLPIILSGNAPFEIIYSANNQEFTIISNSTFFPLNVSPSETTTYNLISVSDENGCLNENLTGTATITVHNIPIIQNVIETTEIDTYTISFEVISSSNFSVSGNATTINGNMVTSDPIPCGNDYNFTVTNDCGMATTSGMVNCGDVCNNSAGTLDLTQIIECEGVTISVNHNGDEIFDIGDILQFALLSTTGDFPFNILAIQSSPDFNNLNAGNYQIAAIVGEDEGNGQINISDPCLKISDAVQISITEQPFEPISLQWPDSLCSGNELKLITDTYPDGTIYNWILPNGEEVQTDSSSLVIPDVAAGDEGFYNVYVGIGDCFSEPFEEAGFVKVIDVGVVLDTLPACGENGALLEAANIDFGIGVWSNLNTNVLIDEPLNPITSVSNLAVGENIFVWSVVSDLCNISDTTRVFFNPEIEVANDSFIMESTSLTLAFNPYQNDNLDNFDDTDIEINIISEPEFGDIELGNGIMEYTREGEFEGEVFIVYEICSQSPLEDCENACDTATVKITVLFDPNIPLASRGVTPNGDGANDIWKILNIHQNPNNQVVITNRWGDVIFQRTGYRNEEGNAWDGTYRGSILPQGAYYFVIETNPGEEENVVLTGTVYLIL